MSRLTQKTLAEWRDKTLAAQGGRCLLCGEPIAAGEAVADHDHKTGHMRGVLHRGCNAMLGHLENNRPRNKLTDPVKFARFLSKAGGYIAGVGTHYPEQYPTFRNEEEKRELRNKRARTKRAKAKKDLGPDLY